MKPRHVPHRRMSLLTSSCLSSTMKSLVYLVLGVIAFFVVGDAAPATSSGSAAPTVTIDSGAVIGTTTALAGATVTVEKYLGIPFAASPTRFAPPVKPTSWQSPYQATNYGPACIQQFSYPEAARNASIAWFDTPPPPAGESEDCLNLNVYVPATPGRNKTVMAWIYVRSLVGWVWDRLLMIFQGGSLQFGFNSATFYDGSSFATNQDVIIVTLNYRTNGKGISHPG